MKHVEVFLKGHEKNIDLVTVESFGQEWSKFDEFSEEEIAVQAKCYFDIVSDDVLNKDKVVGDLGCGSGKFTKYVAPLSKEVHAIDPSEAIYVAARNNTNEENVSLYRAAISDMPFKDEFFDFAFSLGVLHHIPNTQEAMRDCVKKVKKGGHFLTYIYYSFDNRGPLFRLVWKLSELIRLVVSRSPKFLKHLFSDILTILIYMPLILLARFLKAIGVSRKTWEKIPLSAYYDKTFHIIRNDCLDRFGTPLEHRFSKQEITEMMKACGLEDIVFSDEPGYWHAIGKRVS